MTVDPIVSLHEAAHAVIARVLVSAGVKPHTRTLSRGGAATWEKLALIDLAPVTFDRDYSAVAADRLSALTQTVWTRKATCAPLYAELIWTTETVPVPIVTVAPGGRPKNGNVYVPLVTVFPFTVVVCMPFTVF
jgi:hypothetical protein